MRRFRSIVAVAAVVVAACSDDDGSSGAPAAAAPATTVVEAAPADDPDVPTIGPLVSGTASVVDGTFVWTDYAYDDHGANEGPGDRTDPTSAGGDAAYAEGGENAADLVQLQVGLDDDGRVTVTAVLQTLLDPEVPVVVVGFDTDGDRATGDPGLGDLWTPASAADALGVDEVAVLRASEGDVVDIEANTLSTTLPLEPGDATWRAYAAVGTLEGDVATVHDLAFVGDEPTYRWQDDVQADVLAGFQPPDVAAADIDFGLLADGATELADDRSPGFHTYLYRSGLELGEGMRPVEGGGFEYRGRYQPYLVYIPPDGTDPTNAMTVFLHGLTQNHLGSVITDGTYLGTGRPLSEEVHLLAEFARDGLDFAPHNLTVWPLARGEALFYEGTAEQDVLDVLADATERLAPDPDRIILSGGSMGGIGAFRLAALHPDRFSVVAPIIGLARGETATLLANLWNLPVRQVNGAQDPLISADGATATTDQLDALELDYRAWMLDARGHEAGGYVYDCVYAGLPAFVRDPDPAEVRYTVDPSQFVTDAASGLDLTYDGAYWVSGMELADRTAPGTAVARSDARPERRAGATHVDRLGESDLEAGGDLCGPSPEVRTGDTWRERAAEPVVEAVEPADRLHLELTNLAAVTVDVTRAGLDGGTVEVRTDVDVRVTLLGDDGPVTVEVPAGESTIPA